MPYWLLTENEEEAEDRRTKRNRSVEFGVEEKKKKKEEANERWEETSL